MKNQSRFLDASSAQNENQATIPKYQSCSNTESNTYVLYVHVKRNSIEADSKIRQDGKMVTNARTIGQSRLQKSIRPLNPMNRVCLAQKPIGA